MIDENLYNDMLDTYIVNIILPDIADHKTNSDMSISLEEMTRRLEGHHTTKIGLKKNAA